MLANCELTFTSFTRHSQPRNMTPKSFSARVERFEGRGTWTFARIPFNVEKEFGVKGKLNVKGTINGKEIEATLMPEGEGIHFIILTKEIREKIKVQPGD